MIPHGVNHISKIYLTEAQTSKATHSVHFNMLLRKLKKNKSLPQNPSKMFLVIFSRRQDLEDLKPL